MRVIQTLVERHLIERMDADRLHELIWSAEYYDSCYPRTYVTDFADRIRRAVEAGTFPGEPLMSPAYDEEYMMACYFHSHEWSERLRYERLYMALSRVALPPNRRSVPILNGALEHVCEIVKAWPPDEMPYLVGALLREWRAIADRVDRDLIAGAEALCGTVNMHRLLEDAFKRNGRVELIGLPYEHYFYKEQFHETRRALHEADEIVARLQALLSDEDKSPTD